MDLGADTWQTFRRITLPALATALFAGALLAFALSFDEIIVTHVHGGHRADAADLDLRQLPAPERPAHRQRRRPGHDPAQHRSRSTSRRSSPARRASPAPADRQRASRGTIIRWQRSVDLDGARARLIAERARLTGRARRADREPRPDDVRLPGRRGDPRLRAAARPRPARPIADRSSTRRGGAAGARRRDLRHVRRPAATRSRRSGSRRSRGRRPASTAPGSGPVTAATRPPDDGPPRRRGRCAARLARRHPGRSGESRRRGTADAAGAVRDGRPGRTGAGSPESRVAAADRRVQDPRRLPRDRVADAGASGRAASSPTPRATMRKASRWRPDCWERGP